MKSELLFSSPQLVRWEVNIAVVQFWLLQCACGFGSRSIFFNSTTPFDMFELVPDQPIQRNVERFLPAVGQDHIREGSTGKLVPGFQTIGDIVSKETVCCVGGKVKH